MDRKGSETTTKGSIALPIAGFLTGGYLVVVVGLLWYAGRTSDDLFRLDLNELGDFLAGVSAPLAFLWLVAAVFIQRRELELTRQEFENNRQVTLEQAKEAKNQARFIGEQVTILREQQLAGSRSRGDVLYRQRFESFVEDVRGHHVMLFYRRRLNNHADEVYRFQNLTASLTGLRVFVEGATAEVRERGKRGAIMPEDVIDSLIFSAFQLREALNLASSISHDHATRADVYGLIDAFDSYLAADLASSDR